MTNPFAGILQGLQATDALMGQYRAPGLAQMDMLQRQAQLDQASQGMALAQERMDINRRQEYRLDRQLGMQQQQAARAQQQQQAQTLSTIAYAASKLDPDDQKRFVDAVAPRFDIDPSTVTPDSIKQFATLYESQIKKGGLTKGESAQFKDESGNTYAVTTMLDKQGNSRQVVTPMTPGAPAQPDGQLEQVSKGTGMTASERINFATQQALSTSEAGALGKRRDEIKASYSEGRNTALSSLRSIKDLKNIVSGFGEGGLSKAGRSLANKFPILRNASEEEFLSLANQVILSQKDDLLGGGILSDSDIALLQSIGPQLGATKEGNERILDNMESAANASVENERLFSQHIKNGGTPEGFIIPDRLSPDDFVIEEQVKEASEPLGPGKKITTKSGITFTVTGE